MPGRLYVVATPIGNLEDITFRAVRCLGEVSVIACEDTRQTRKLLLHYGIQTATISYHEHNEVERARELVDRLVSGQDVAIVSDAGTPLVSDPGFRLVQAAVEAGIVVIPLPGPSAILAALSASGLPTDAFHFGGFLPAKPGQRRKLLERLAGERATLIFYETPHRIVAALEDIHAVLGSRALAIGRELTKLHEEILRGTALELSALLGERGAIKGEMTILIDRAADTLDDDTPIPEAVADALRGGLSRMDAMKQVARQRGISKREVYDAVENAEK